MQYLLIPDKNTAGDALMKFYEFNNATNEFELADTKNYGAILYLDHSVSADYSLMGIVFDSQTYLIDGIKEKNQKIAY